jgi:hypothetical protein
MQSKCWECDEKAETNQNRMDIVPVSGHLDRLLGEKLLGEIVLFGEILLHEKLLKTAALLAISCLTNSLTKM